MSIEFEFKLIGAKELENALKQFPKSVAKAALRQTLKKAAKPILSSARANAPRRTGKLAKSIVISTRLKRTQRKRYETGVSLFVGSTSSRAHWFEFGFYPGGGAKFVKRPFLRPAWDANKARVKEIFEKEIWKVMEKKASQLARKATAGKLSKSAVRFFGG